MSCLHLYLISCAQHGIDTDADVVAILLDRNKTAGLEKFNKNFPLHSHLERNSHASVEVVEMLVDACPDSLRMHGDAGACPLVTYLCAGSINQLVDSLVVEFLLQRRSHHWLKRMA